MTIPVSGDNSVNLAALWVPVMPETSHLRDGLKEAGAQAQKSFQEGFVSGGGADQFGKSFATTFAASFAKQLKGADIGLGVSALVDKMSSQVDSGLATRLKTQLPAAFRASTAAANEYATALQKIAPKLQQEAELTERLSALKTQHNSLSTEANRLQAQASQAWSSGNVTLAEQQRLQTLATEASRRSNDVLLEQDKVQQLLSSHRQASAPQQERLLALQEKATSAQERYNGQLQAYQEASSSAFRAGSLFSGMLGGAMVLGISAVVSGFEHLISLGENLFEDAVHGAEELAERLIDVGEQYHQLEIQTTEYSGASGAALAELQEHVEKVYGSLDVAGKDLGKTMGQLGSMLSMGPGQALDRLSKSVVELQGRFSNLKSQDVASIFVAFGTPASEVNSALDSLVANARDAGVGLGDLASALSGDSAAALHEAGLSLGQAAHFVAELEKHGLPARSVMMGMSSAMKQFGKDGLSFADGMREAGKELEALGDSAEGNKLASDLFGGRRWTEAVAMVREFNATLNATPGAFNGSAGAAQNLIDSTEDLDNKIQEFKHHVEGMFKPFAEGAEEAVSGGLDKISHWFDSNHDEILMKIRQWGDTFLSLIPGIARFGEVAISVLAQIANLTKSFVTMAGEFGAFLENTWGRITGDKEAVKRSDEMLTAMKNMEKLDFGKAADNLNRFLDQFISKVPEAQQGLDNLTNSMLNTSQAPVAPPGTVPGAPIGPPQGSSGTPIAPGGAPFNTPGPKGTQTPSGQLPSFAPQDQQSGYAGADKGSLAKAIYGAVVGAGYSSQTALYAVSAALYESNLDPKVTNASGHHGLFQESSDKPSAGAQQQINWFISKLNSLGGPAAVNADPANVIANQVEVGGYSGSAYNAKLGEAKNLLGVASAATGGWISGGKGGIDDIPALLTHGEFVVKKEAMDNPRIAQLVSFMNSNPRGFAGGGSASYAASGAGNDLSGVNAQISAITSIANGFGLTLTAGKSGHGTHDVDKGYHDSGEAGDFSNGDKTDAELAFAAYMYQHFGSELAELIHDDPRWTHNIKDGKDVGPMGKFYTTEQAGYHGDHVHIAVKTSQTLQDTTTPGSEPIVSGSSGIPGGSSMPSMPGMPGGGGMPVGGTRGIPGYGAYGGETYDQQREHQRAIEHANDRVTDLNRQIQDKTQERDDLQKEVTRLQGLPDLDPDKQKVAAKQKQLDRLNEDLDKLKGRELPEAQEDLEDAQRKSQEAYLKPPSARGSYAQAPGSDAARSFGSSLLGGIGESLGFPDVFGKPPWEFGAFKLLAGLGNMGFSWANQIGNAMYGQGGRGGSLPGFAGGMGGSIGMPNIPSMQHVPGAPGGVTLPVPGGGVSGPTGPQPGTDGATLPMMTGPIPGAPPGARAPVQAHLAAYDKFNAPGLPAKFQGENYYQRRYSPSGPPPVGDPLGQISGMLFNFASGMIPTIGGDHKAVPFRVTDTPGGGGGAGAQGMMHPQGASGNANQGSSGVTIVNHNYGGDTTTNHNHIYQGAYQPVEYHDHVGGGGMSGMQEFQNSYNRQQLTVSAPGALPAQ